jgi:hypothetical protein
MTRQHVHLKKT